MENTPVTVGKNGEAEEDLYCAWSKDMKAARKKGFGLSKSKIGSLVRTVNSKHMLECSGNKFQIQSSRGLNNGIPKHLVSLDERYIWGFLEQIHISASKAALSNSLVNLGTSKLGDESNLTNVSGKNTCDLTSFVVEWPLTAVARDVSVNSTGPWIVGTVIGSKSMINILKSPLFLKEETINSNPILNSNLLDIKGSVCLDLSSYHSGLSVFGISSKLQKETALLANHRYGSRKGHMRHAPISSKNLSCRDQPSNSTFFALSTSSHGMLRCTWKHGIPHYIFSIDNQREVYEANLTKAASTDNKAPDYVYLFYLSMNDQKGHRACKDESTLIGKMKVSTSFALCPNNSMVADTEFVLFGAADQCVGGVQTSSHDRKESHGFTKKVAKAFGSKHGHQCLIPKCGGARTSRGNHSWEPYQKVGNNVDQSPSVNLLDDDLPPNLELAAVVARDHLHHSEQNVGAGGWGLKFLNTRFNQASACADATSDCLDAMASSECCPGDCSTNMEILVPADFHGGPITGDVRPSSLIQRWRSGGGCDCGGWDIGCPLTILDARWSKEVYLSQKDAQGVCKSFNLFTQGSEQSVPTLKVVSIHDSLYYVQFRPTLSALQSLALSAAIIHTQSPALRPKNTKESNRQE